MVGVAVGVGVIVGVGVGVNVGTMVGVGVGVGVGTGSLIVREITYDPIADDRSLATILHVPSRVNV